MKVMKFGGTSVGTPARMQGVAALIQQTADRRIVVLSAVSGTTNSLVSIADALLRNDRVSARDEINSLREKYTLFTDDLVDTDAGRQSANAVLAEHFEFLEIVLKISYSEALRKDILAQGELLSTKLFSVYLHEQKVPHVLLPALEFMTIDNREEPQIGSIRVRLGQLLQQHPDTRLFVTQGFICRNARGEIDNLKRGGSDYTASLIAAATSASVCEIWTDIDGMHNNDPRVVSNTAPLASLSFEEAAELAYFGAKILHPASIWPAQQYSIPVRLLNTLNPEAEGTIIQGSPTSNGIKAMAAKDGITVINIRSSRMLLAYGFLRKVFQVFERHKTSIDMITTSEVAVSVSIDNDEALPLLKKELEELGTVAVLSDQSIVSIVGYELAQDDTVLQKVFAALNGLPVGMVSYGGSPHNISLLLPSGDKKEALLRLHAGLFDPNDTAN